MTMLHGWECGGLSPTGTWPTASGIIIVASGKSLGHSVLSREWLTTTCRVMRHEGFSWSHFTILVICKCTIEHINVLYRIYYPCSIQCVVGVTMIPDLVPDGGYISP